MPIIMRLDRVMADRKMKSNDLAAMIGISPVNLSRIKTGHIRAMRFSTLELICEILECQPGDIMEYQSPPSEESEATRQRKIDHQKTKSA